MSDQQPASWRELARKIRHRPAMLIRALLVLAALLCLLAVVVRTVIALIMIFIG